MSLIDTHAHLQFQAFEGKVDEVIKSASEAGIEKIIVVGTNLETSKKAVELAQNYEGVFASVGVHPHHVFSYCHSERSEESVQISTDPSKELESPPDFLLLRMTKEVFDQLEQLLKTPKIVAIGETGLDHHIYQNTHYKDYQITDEFINLQKLFFKKQINVAIKHKKSLIIHNREAVPEMLQVLEENWDSFLETRSVFHCCEPDQRLLDFAIKHKVFIGIDGDITYDPAKQDFIKQVPLTNIVLETDSPYFIPEPLRSEGITLNDPQNLNITAEFIAQLINTNPLSLKTQTLNNSLRLFNL